MCVTPRSLAENAAGPARQRIEIGLRPALDIAWIHSIDADAQGGSPQAAAFRDLRNEAAATAERVSIPALGVEPTRA